MFLFFFVFCDKSDREMIGMAKAVPLPRSSVALMIVLIALHTVAELDPFVRLEVLRLIVARGFAHSTRDCL